jgi:protein-disulfide isomerase
MRKHYSSLFGDKMFQFKKLNQKGETNVMQTVMVVVLIVAAFFIGMLWTKVQSFEKGATPTTQPATAAQATPQPKATSADFANLLSKVVDAKALKSCVDSGKYDSQLSADQDSAGSLSVSGTPGFLVNTGFFGGAFNYNTIQPTVNAALGIGTAPKLDNQPNITLAQVREAFTKSHIKFGDSNGKLILLEVSDPSCPYCHIAGGKDSVLNNQSAQFKLVADGGTYVAPVPEMKKLADEGKASFALIYFPGHGNGELAMKSLYCAFDQGKFWEANDIIMSNTGYMLMNR